MLKKLFSHTAIYGLAPQITKIASFFSLPLITQELTDIDYGVAGVLGAYTAAISVLATLGLNMILVNTYFKNPNWYTWVWRQLYGFLALWNIFYAIILAVLIYFVVPEEAKDNRWTILLLNIGPLVFFGQTSIIGALYYQLKQKPIQIAIRSSVFGVLAVSLNVIFIYFLKMGYMGWFWSAFVVGMLNNLSYFYPLNFVIKIKPIFNYKWRLVKNSLKISLPLVPHYYSSYLMNSSDKMVMDILNVSTSSVGKYNIAYTVGNVMNSLAHASGMAVSPLLMKFFKEKNDLSAKYLIMLMQISLLVITFCFSIWMKEIFGFLIKNEEMAKMYYLGIIIVMAVNYRPMYIGLNAKLMYAETPQVLWRLTFTAGIINVILNLLLIPVFGFEVAAITTFIGYFFMGYAGYYFKTFKEISTVNYNVLPWMILTILISLIAYFSVEINLYYKVVISFIAILFSVIALYMINKILIKNQITNSSV